MPVVQGVKCHSRWLHRSWIVDVKEQMSVVSFFGLARAAWEDVSDVQS